jgi:tRNA pseudouridine55 synthase
VEKPKDMTSFAVVAAIKRHLKVNRVGHCGTLDPLARGVLPIFLGKATKAIALLPDTNKEYIADFQLGIKSDTQDISGTLSSSPNFKKNFANREKILNTLNEFLGESLQIPPMFSALKQNGKRLYELARVGVEVKREPRTIKITEIKLLEYSKQSGAGKIFVSCSKGTYIRTICHDLGKKLGCGAVLTDLFRVKASGFSLEQSLQLKELLALPLSELNIISIENLFEIYSKVSISAAQCLRFKNGGSLSLERINFLQDVNDREIFCEYEMQGNFLGLGIVQRARQELGIVKTF